MKNFQFKIIQAVKNTENQDTEHLKHSQLQHPKATYAHFWYF